MLHVLRCIAEQDCKQFPSACETLLYNTYVDEICVGGDTVAELISIQAELVRVLQGVKMELKKWSSNAVKILEWMPPKDKSCGLLSFDDSFDIGIKILGYQWSQRDDAFMYSFQCERTIVTKRGMLSLVTRMFYALGLLPLVIFLTKQLIQRVWIAGVRYYH